MTSSTTRAYMAKKQSTSFAQVATNLLNVLQGYTKTIRLLLIMFLTLTASTAWGATTTYTFTSKSWADNSNGWTSGKDGNALTSNQGVQVTTGVTGANATTKNSFTNISSITVQYCTNSSKGKGSISIQVGSNTAKSFSVSAPSSNGTTLKSQTFTFNPNETGKVKITVTCSTNSIYIYSVTITTADAVTCTTNPTVSAGSNSNVTTTTATVSCSDGITSLGSAGCSIESYGFVYGTSSNPTISNSKVQVGTTYTTTGAAFSKELTGLTANTTYYVRPYATNGKGTAYGTQTSFKTLELPKYTVTLKDDNSTLTQSSAGESVTLPPRNGCDGYTFVGWTKSWSVAQTTWTTTAPTIIPKGSYTPTANESLYPVYTKTEGGGSEPTVYLAGDVGSFIIASNVSNKWYAIPENPTLNSGKITGVEITVSQTAGGVKYVSTANAEGYTWTIADATNGQTISDGSKYIYHSNGGSSGTNLAYGTSTSYTWKIEKENNGLTFKGMSGSTTNSRGLLFNGSVFGGYALSNEDASGYYRIQVLPIGGGSTTSYISVPECTIKPSYSVTYKGNGNTSGSVPTDDTKYANDAQVIVLGNTGNLAKTGYTFSGWNTEADGKGNTYAVGAKFNITENTILYAQWTANIYTITLNTNDGTINSGDISSYTYGVGATLPTDVTKTGYTFAGWYNNSDFTGDPIKTIGTTETDNKEFWAKWTPAVYTINYKDQGDADFSGQHEAGYPKNHTYNTTTTLKSASKEHYAFDGWYKESACSGTKVTTLGATEYTDDITLYAKWTAKTYTITLDAGTGECDTESVTTTNASGVTLPTASHTCTDWTFAGWWTEEVSSTSISLGTLLNAGDTYNPTSDITLYAVYSTQEAGDAFTGYAKVTTAPDDWSGKYLLSTGTYTANGTYDSNVENGHLVRETYTPGNEEKAEWEFTLAKVGNTGYSILFPDGSYYLGYASSTNFARSTTVVQSDNVAYLWTPSTSGITNVSATSRKIADDGTDDFRPYSSPSSGIVYLYKRIGGGSTTIYNSNPTCLVPVWNGATIDKTSFTVNCGGRSPMTGANAAAIISFPTEDIYNFTKDITIEATTGFLVSTSQNVDANYKSSVSLSPLVGTANANTFYDKHVYVRAEAPAMSEEDLSGTITIKNNKDEILQTFSVTADVTCNTYTLTLNDRGTKTTAEYYAGASVPTPEAPTGVCTDPIHYVFDGWSLNPVTDENTTSYEKVTFPFNMPAEKTTLYAVYRWSEAGGGDGDYHLVEEELDDWSGDYLIAYSNTIFADGRIGGGKEQGAIGAQNVIVDLSHKIDENTIPAENGDTYKVTLEAVIGGYVLKTQDGKYNYHTNNTENDISARDKSTAEKYPITVKFVSEEEINLCLGGSAIGSVFRYNAQGFFRFYKNGGQQPVYLYKKADGANYFTTSPVCGAHLAITEGKEIYVTGGNAGGTRDLVIAQQKVSYKATRLNVGPTSQVPDVKVATNGITVGGVVTSDVKVTIDQNKEQQTDGTYTITGTITVQYQPSANNKQEDIQVQLAVDYNAEARDNFTVHARSLPSEFVIVAKSGDKWYALNGDMNNGSSANPANGQVTLDDDANPTKATYAPCNTIYTFDGVPNTGDRTRVRFQGTDGAWLWAASGTNVGIQNKSLKETPESNNKAYNWKLETDDNITYKFHNDNNSRLLGLNGEKFGMYASGVQDIRILPYVEKCLYNYAPTNLKVTVLKGTYVTLTWDAVAGATKYQYRTDTTNWTDCGTEPTATINDLTVATGYTYYIRAYHEDTGVSQECIDYAEITFTTADCDDVPTDITYTADLNSITVSWTAAAPTATIKLFMDEEGTHLAGSYPGATSPKKISGGLKKNTTYYIQILADGTCASPIIPVKTEDVEVDIVEWQPQGIVVDINTDETIGVTLENEVSYGSGLGTEATELFFSKYYEASYNVKLVAIYNGTKNIIDLTDYIIKYGKTSWETNYITLKDFGATKGQIQPGEEIILYSMQDGTQDDDIMDCVHKDFPDGNWVEVTSSNNTGKGTLSFAGDKTLALFKGADIIDIIGAVNGSIPNNSKANEKPSWGDKEGWVCETGLSIADDSQIGISTNRCLLIRNNTVTSGENAVASNINDFVTLCTEWKGAQVPDNDIDNGVAASCENFAYVGTFDYSDYYTKYVQMGGGTTFDENARNADGTVTIPITDLYKHACSNIRVKLTNSKGEVLSNREYKVPIMITTTQGTDGQTFLDLQQNLATKEVDGGGNVIATHPLSLAEVREICKTCDVVIRDNATLTKVTDGTDNDHPQVHDVIVYEGASIVIPDGEDHNYTINGLSLRRKGDKVASAQVQGTGKLVLPADVPVTLNMRIDANNWHWFTLPYDCDITDVTWSDGTEAKYNTDWFLMYYDGESRAASTNPHDNHWKVYNGTTIEAGKGYIIGITGDLAHPDYTFELRFPMAQEVLIDEKDDKEVAVNAWGVQSDNTPNNLGWNLVGNPYLNYYKTADEYSLLAGLPLIHYINTDPETGEWNYENSGSVPYVATPIDGGWYEYRQELASEVNMMPFTAYFVQVGDPETHTNGQDLKASFEASNRGKKSIVRRAPREVEEIEEPIIVRVELTNSKGESDKTSLVIDDRFTNEYEMNGDFFKWFGDYYNYYTKPVLYTIGADQGKRAFNALNEELAKQPIPMGMYAAQAGNYTFSLNQQFDLSRVEEVWLYDATENVYTNLMQQDYTFSTTKVNGEGRFSLSVKMMPELSTEIENIKQGNIWATTRNNEIVVNGLSKGMQLWIYDATGKLLHSDRTTNYQHSYGIPQTGAYFIRVHNNNEAQTIAVVVE